jgi:ribosomal protein S25
MKGKSTASRPRSTSSRSRESREQLLAKILDLIERHPGIRPAEINRRLRLQQSDALRDALVGRGVVRKVKSGHATHLYLRRT